MKAVARELGLPTWQLYEWRKLYAPRPGEGGPTPQALAEAVQANERLRTEVIRLRERESGLKNRWASPPKPRGRYAQIETMKGEHPIRMLYQNAAAALIVMLSAANPSDATQQ